MEKATNITPRTRCLVFTGGQILSLASKGPLEDGPLGMIKTTKFNIVLKNHGWKTSLSFWKGNLSGAI